MKFDRGAIRSDKEYGYIQLLTLFIAALMAITATNNHIAAALQSELHLINNRSLLLYHYLKRQHLLINQQEPIDPQHGTSVTTSSISIKTLGEISFTHSTERFEIKSLAKEQDGSLHQNASATTQSDKETWHHVLVLRRCSTISSPTPMHRYPCSEWRFKHSEIDEYKIVYTAHFELW